MFRDQHRTVWLLLVGLMLITRAAVAAQESGRLRGTVLAPSGEPVGGAHVVVGGQDDAVTTADGRFDLSVPDGAWDIAVSHPAHRAYQRRVMVPSPALELHLDWVASVEESVTVVGIRSGQDTPVTTRNLDREEIASLSYGQDVPELLGRAPAMNWYSDSGTGSNYSYFSLRGIQQTRVSMTFDGAPLNDPAEHALFFNNVHDFTNTVDSIQIQRGVGTSSVGSPAYGGSVNFASRPPTRAPGGDARIVLGSFGTTRGSVGYESGMLDNGLYARGRVSVATTDGYRERSGSEHRTFFLDAGWQGDRSSLSFVSFFGQEESQLAYLAVEPVVLAENRRANPLTDEDRDRFGQDFAQLKYIREVSADTVITASLYYNGADGWFQLWDDPVAQTDLLRFGIDQGFYGSMVTLTKSTGRLSATVGVHYNDFAGDHLLDTEALGRQYLNTGFKRTANAFGKLEYTRGDTLLFGDLHLRWADFTYEGDVPLGSVDWVFFDPKVGVRHTLAPGLSLYGSVGRAQREPARLDLLLGEDNATVPHDLTAVRPESVVDLEVGTNWNTARVSLQANAYFMEFRDEIALTGELSEVGLPLRRNVDRSYRRGIELDVRWVPVPSWAVVHSLNVSRNRIQAWNQLYDVFDPEGGFVETELLTYQNVRPLLTPELLFNLGVEWSNATTSVGATGRYVSTAQLDNTDLADFRTPAFANVDLRASQTLTRWASGVETRVTVFVNNLFDSLDQLPAGYSYQFLTRSETGQDARAGIPFFYPLATRNMLVSLEVGF